MSNRTTFSETSLVTRKWSVRQHASRVLSGLLAVSLWLPVPFSIAASNEQIIDFHVLPVHRGYSRRDSFYVAIRSLEEWNRLSSLHVDSPADALVPQPPPAGVDFARATLLVANAGLKHSLPITVVFNSVIDAGSEIRVRVTVTGPGTCPGFPEEGSVSAMALIPRTDRPIQFDVSNIDRDCTHR
jgi:hypothetical protein